MQADILIIGGGLVGLAIAHRLAQAGRAPVLVEAGTPGAGTTGAAAGMLCPGFEPVHVERALQARFHAFGMRSLALWPRLAETLEAETGHDIDLRLGAAPGGGAIGLARTRGEADEMQALCAMLRGEGRDAAWLDRDALVEAEPGIGQGPLGGLLLADEGQVDPRLTATALAAALGRRGVPVLSGLSITGLVERGGRIVAAQAGEERIETGLVIIAAGLASRDFWREGAEAPFFSIKGQAMSLAVPADADPSRLPRRVLRGPGVYICPKNHGRIVIGASEEDHVETLSTDAGVIARLHRAAGDTVPGLREASGLEEWAGLRPTTPDRLPVIGRSGAVSNLIYAGGHHRNGILLAPVTAEHVLALVEGAPDDPLVSPARFSR